MFPIPWNKAYRKKDGSLVNIDDAISGGGGAYELPTASAETKGGVKIGSGLSMNGEVLSATGAGNSLHMYLVTTNQLAASKMYVLTTVDDDITSYAKLKTALTTGIGFIVSGGVPGSSYAPVYAKFVDSGTTLITVYAIKNSADQDMWSTSTLSGSATISSSKVF